MTRIGIIEDDRLLNEALCTYLETLGYITDSAFSFEEGMALADKHPDLLLADIGLADGSGIEICRMVRGKTPVIFLTAKDGCGKTPSKGMCSGLSAAAQMIIL